MRATSSLLFLEAIIGWKAIGATRFCEISFRIEFSISPKVLSMVTRACQARLKAIPGGYSNESSFRAVAVIRLDTFEIVNLWVAAIVMLLSDEMPKTLGCAGSDGTRIEYPGPGSRSTRSRSCPNLLTNQNRVPNRISPARFWKRGTTHVYIRFCES
jgi:hypothetical protein